MDVLLGSESLSDLGKLAGSMQPKYDLINYEPITYLTLHGWLIADAVVPKLDTSYVMINHVYECSRIADATI
jgi:hypothetical protein